MPIRRRSDNGNWLVDIRIDGRRIRETHPGRLTKREVQALERARRAEIEAEGVGSADSWAALAGRYWLEHGEHLAWRVSIKGHLNALSDLIGDRTPVRSISSATFARGVALWRQTLAPATVNRRLAVAQGIWRRAVDLWALRLPAIPWRLLRVPVPDRLPAYVPPSVRDAIMARALPHVRLAMQIALATGWRRGSILALTWADIDWSRALITGRGKGPAGGTALVHPLTDELRAILVEAAGHHDDVMMTAPIVAWQGRAVTEIDDAFDRARRAAGHPHVQFKALRHSVAQEVLAATGSMDLAGAVLAHRQISTTRKHYARVQVDAVRAALEARERALKRAQVA